MGSTFFNTDAEHEIIAAFMNDREALANARKINAEDFYDKANREIFAAIQVAAVSGHPVTYPVVAETLVRMYGNDNHMAHLARIVSEKPLCMAWSIVPNAEIVRTAAQRRTLYEVLTNAREAITDGTRDTADVLEEARQALRQMNTTKHKWVNLQTVLMEAFSTLERRCSGEEPSMCSGLESLDRITGGFHRGELVVLGARPAVGKSAIALHFAHAAASAGYRVASCSREMAAAQQGERWFVRGASVDSYRMRTGKLTDTDWANITEAMTTYSGLNIDYMFDAKDIESLREAVQTKVDGEGLDVLFVDYLQIMDTRRKFRTEYEQVSYVSKALKDMTIDLGICIIALAQVGRSSDGSMPTLAELRGSGAIEQDADVVLFMHKPKAADDEFVFPDDRGLFNGALESTGQEYVALDIAKNRQGLTRTVPVLFNPSRMMYTDIFRGMKEV